MWRKIFTGIILVSRIKPCHIIPHQQDYYIETLNVYKWFSDIRLFRGVNAWWAKYFKDMHQIMCLILKKVIASWASYLKDYYQGFMENTIAMFPSITLREGESNIATLSLTNRIATLCRSCLTASFFSLPVWWATCWTQGQAMCHLISEIWNINMYKWFSEIRLFWKDEWMPGGQNIWRTCNQIMSHNIKSQLASWAQIFEGSLVK